MNLSTPPSSRGMIVGETKTVAGQRDTDAGEQQRSSTVKMIGVVGLSSGAAVIAALSLPAAASAVPTGGSPAADVVSWLRDNGYHVQVNGAQNGPLSQCVATGIHGLRNSNVDSQGRQRDRSMPTTVYVDIACNNTA
jgi:hypothetical protein